MTFLFDVSVWSRVLVRVKKMSSDESDSPTTLVPPELLRIKNNQSPSLIIKQENGTPTIQIVSSSSSDASNLSTGGTMLMPIVNKTSGLPLGSAVKVRRRCLVVVKLQRLIVSIDSGRAVVASRHGGRIWASEQPISDRRAASDLWAGKQGVFVEGGVLGEHR